MANSFSNAADVVNAALDRVGYKKNIGNLYDGSEQAIAALTIYGQTRDDLLRNFEWGFAERDISLTLLKTAPVGGYSDNRPWDITTDPIPPFIYEYEYPEDMLKLRSLPAKRVVLTNLASAIGVYTARVTSPLQWDVGFTESLIAQLGRRLAPVLAGLDAAKMEVQDEAVTTQTAEMKLG